MHALIIIPTCSLHLSALRSDLARCSLRLLLASNTASCLSTPGRSSSLSLLRLPLALGRALLLLALLDRCLAGRSTGFWTLGSSLFNHIKGGADDGSLVLDCATGAFFGDFLLKCGGG